jgi:hypothetical protein
MSAGLLLKLQRSEFDVSLLFSEGEGCDQRGFEGRGKDCALYLVL